MIQDIISETANWFRKAVVRPTSKNLHTQLGCHFEEVGEMLVEIESTDFETTVRRDNAIQALHDLAVHLKQTDNVIKITNRQAYLDALADQVVTATGCAHMSDMDLPGALFEVNRSNFSKFDENGEPIFNDNLKVMKGPNYRAPDLSAYV